MSINHYPWKLGLFQYEYHKPYQFHLESNVMELIYQREPIPEIISDAIKVLHMLP